jgi:rSAM-associated Gly-rich repeat protein
MFTSSRFSLLVLLMAFAALAAPASARTTSPTTDGDVEARLERISLALLQRFDGEALQGTAGGTAVARGFVNGGPGRGFANGVNRGFVNNHGYYGGSRSFVNGGGGYRGGGFVNAARPGVGFVNW